MWETLKVGISVVSVKEVAKENSFILFLVIPVMSWGKKNSHM